MHKDITLNKDGTITDYKNRLQWTQSAWNGQTLGRNPIYMTWQQASELFGKGGKIKGIENRGVLPSNMTENSAKENGYLRGNSNLFFAGYSDWRLPTCKEASMLKEYDKSLFDISLDSRYFWTANKRSYGEPTWLDKLSNILSTYRVAWKFNLDGEISDEGTKKNDTIGHLVLLIRNI